MQQVNSVPLCKLYFLWPTCSLCPAGAGKSSLLGALLRMTELEAGSICIGGVDICHVPLMRLRRCLAYIPQTAFLFEVGVPLGAAQHCKLGVCGT